MADGMISAKQLTIFIIKMLMLKKANENKVNIMHKYTKWAIVLAIMIAVVLMIGPFNKKGQIQEEGIIPADNLDYYTRFQNAKKAGKPIFVEFFGRY